MKYFIISAIIFLSCTLAAYGQSGSWSDVESTLGKTGMEQGGVYKVAFPRTDLKVTKLGVPVAPGVALTSWMGFMKNKDQAMVMGDLVLLETEVQPAMAALFSSGIEVTALHNHLFGTSPNVLYLHFSGMGDPAKLAKGLRSALAVTSTPTGEGAPSPAGASPDWSKVEKALGATGQKKGGLAQFSFPRNEPIREGGMEIPPSMGLATTINMEMVGGKAETSGDFVLVADEVNPVAKALVNNGIEVTAIHSHMLGESPRLFFMHFWGIEEPERLAQGLKATLDAMKSK